MTGHPRPDLGGLFDGTTPSDRPSSIAGRLGARPVTAPAGPTIASNPGIRFEWFDPVKAIDTYFGVLHAVLDAHRKFAVMLVTAPGSLLR